MPLVRSCRCGPINRATHSLVLLWAVFQSWKWAVVVVVVEAAANPPRGGNFTKETTLVSSSSSSAWRWFPPDTTAATRQNGTSHNHTVSSSSYLRPRRQQQQQHELELAHSGGVPRCACQPGRWTFVLDFARTTCGRMQVQTPGEGLSSIGCRIEPMPDNMHVQLGIVRYIYINEYNSYEQTLNDPTSDASPQFVNEPDIPQDSYVNGDTFTYTSVLAKPSYYGPSGSLIPPKEKGRRWKKKTLHVQERPNANNALPQRMEITLDGEDSWGGAMTFVVILEFSMDCYLYPIIVPGDYFGPLTVVRSLYCCGCGGFVCCPRETHTSAHTQTFPSLSVVLV